MKKAKERKRRDSLVYSHDIWFPFVMKSKWMFLVLSLFFAQNIYAQYNVLRFPQTKEEIYRAEHYCISKEMKYSLKDGKKNIIYEKWFNPSGYLTLKKTVSNTKYYVYHPNNKVKLFVDTLISPEDRSYFPYDFEYENPKGLLSFFRGFAPSRFFYDEQKNMLMETQLTENGAYYKRYFYYNKRMDVIKEYHTTPYEDTERVIIHTYNERTGKPTKEIEIRFLKTKEKDSVVSTYLYDKSNNLICYRTASFMFRRIMKDSIATAFKMESDSISYFYTYDNKYRKIKEKYIYHQDTAYNYQFVFEYDKKNILLPIKETYQSNNSSRQVSNYYAYTFLDKTVLDPYGLKKAVIVPPKKKVVIKKTPVGWKLVK